MTRHEIYRLQRASLEHLLDLKRAGHSPRLVELIVHPRSDRILAQPTAATTPAPPRRGRPRKGAKVA